MRLYSAAFSSSETFCLFSPSAATRSVCVPEASSVSLVEGSAEEPSPEPEGPAAEPSELSRPPRSGSPRSVVIFTVPDSCCTSDAAIFSMSSCALIFGRSGSPESASAGTSPIVAAAMPTTVAGTTYRAALRRRAERSSSASAAVALSSDSYGAMCALPPSSAAAVNSRASTL
ncbi:hypothetical protein M2157_004096 [Streptomyces sp. SAI-127]|nr:hypothetical protein [Streptomyces sp. SAI-127]